MAERLRALLERPLDAAVCRAVVVMAAGLFTGLALLALVASGGEPASRRPPGPASAGRQRLVHQPPSRSLAPGRVPPGTARRRHPAQDPQDRSGSPAARRAARALRTHRAFQHVPYRRGALRISLTGAQGERAVLSVSAPTLAGARRGWHAFLRRYRDDGRTYLPRFWSRRGPHG